MSASQPTRPSAGVLMKVCSGSKADSDKATPGTAYDLTPSTRHVPALGRLTLRQLQRLGSSPDQEPVRAIVGLILRPNPIGWRLPRRPLARGRTARDALRSRSPAFRRKEEGPLHSNNARQQPDRSGPLGNGASRGMLHAGVVRRFKEQAPWGGRVRLQAGNGARPQRTPTR
jgi:hypothetical protein